MPDINVNKLSEALNTKADIDLNNTGVFSTSSGGVNLVQSTPSDAKGREVASADFSLKQGGLELMDVGFAPLGIDESKNKRRYLNGQLIIQSQFPAFTAAVKSRMTTMANAFTTEANWQAEKTNSKLGQCGKFVVDDTAGTIRLPAVVNAQGLVSLSGIGNLVNESLPNISGAVCFAQGPIYSGDNPNSALYGTNINTVNQPASATPGDKYEHLNLDASRSSSTYQDNAPVQQEAVQYPYYIQVATGVEETLPAIREYNINTPFFFGQSMYSDIAPDNASWLASNGQYNAKTVYPDYYDWLLEKRNSNTKTFYLWKNLDGNTVLFLTETNALSVGSILYGYNPTIKFGEITAISGNNVTIRNDVVNTTPTVSVDLSNPTYAGNIPVYDSSKMNVISKEELDNWNIPINTSDYDFVINTTDQTFRLPLIAERVLVAKKEPTDGDYTWYNLYSDGWLEQGGYIYQAGDVAGVANTATFPKAFKNNDYAITMFAGVGNSGWQYTNGVGLGTGGVGANERETHMTPTTFTWFNATGVSGAPIFWEAKGYAEVPTQSDYTEVSGLYYYVGDTVQDASLINAGAVLGQLSDKISRTAASDRELVVGWGMPDYETDVTGSQSGSGSWTKVNYDAFVVSIGTDSHAENYDVKVSPDNGTTSYIVGHRTDDYNNYTQVTSFTFFVPAGWYFRNYCENGSTYHIYKLKGAN